MSFIKRDGDRVTLEMTVEDYDSLLTGMMAAFCKASEDGAPAAAHRFVMTIARITENDPGDLWPGHEKTLAGIHAAATLLTALRNAAAASEN